MQLTCSFPWSQKKLYAASHYYTLGLTLLTVVVKNAKDLHEVCPLWAAADKSIMTLIFRVIIPKSH